MLLNFLLHNLSVAKQFSVFVLVKILKPYLFFGKARSLPLKGKTLKVLMCFNWIGSDPLVSCLYMVCVVKQLFLCSLRNDA
jgi:hypothetical protein